MGYLKRVTIPTVLLLFLFLFCTNFTSSDAYDTIDPDGNITIKWDIMDWTDDGYIANVRMFNFYRYRQIQSPGWALGWTWHHSKMVIWSMKGGRATNQGNCSRFNNGSIPHSCEKHPKIVDLLPDAPENQRTDNCCKGGKLSSWLQDQTAVSSFQLVVGVPGSVSTRIGIPKNFTLNVPSSNYYVCGPAMIVRSSTFPSPDGRNLTRAKRTSVVVCRYSKFVAPRAPRCCVSLSSFDIKTKFSCPDSSFVLPKTLNPPNSSNSTNITSAISDLGKTNSSIESTHHMCPTQVHWHVKERNKDNWLVDVTVTNYKKDEVNYTQWNLVAQHPNSHNLTQLFSFKDVLQTTVNMNGAGIFSGFELHNDSSMQSQLQIKHEKGFPERIYFNGNKCVMPHLAPDAHGGKN